MSTVTMGMSRKGTGLAPPARVLFSRLAVVFLVGIFAYLVCFFAFADFRLVLLHLSDDASYYFRIAENIAAGKGSTFDGVGPTNGYQPLWLAFLVPVSSVFHAAPEVMIRIYLIYQTIILLFASWLFWLTHRKFFPSHVLLFNCVLFTYLVFYSFANGMDSGTLILALALLYYAGYRLEAFTRSSHWRALLFGTLVGFTMLARLDLVFLGAALCGFCLLQAKRRPLQRRFWLAKLFEVLLGATIVCLPYLAYNSHYFGDPVPISAALKSSFPQLSFDVNKLAYLGKRPMVFGTLAFVYLIWAPFGLCRGHSRNVYYRASMTILALSIVLHFLHTSLFMKWAVFGWHFVPYSVFVALVISEPMEHVIGHTRLRNHKWILVVIGVLIFTGLSHRIVDKTLLAEYKDSWRVRGYRAALWAREQSQPSDIFAMKDAGHFAYLSQRSVISLDGVVNNASFQEVLRSQKLGTYLKGHDVKYLAQHVMMSGDPTLLHQISWKQVGDEMKDYLTISLRYKSQKYDSHSDPITVSRACEVYRSKPYAKKRAILPFIIWELGDCDSTLDR
jgi:hypothetical protein